MQTPGRQVESLTPMIAINRRVNTVFERLSKVEEDIVDIERPQQRMFGRILSQFQIVNNSMDTMEDLIRQDINAKKKYFREETKILEQDSKNLQSVRAGFGRQLAAGALGAYGVSQILRGNLGEGALGVGGAAALLTPEILGVISTVVTTRLVKSGLLGRGAGAGTLGTRVAGASRLKNPLLITAALAASLILPGLINSNQTADRRRQLSATRTIRGAETINKPDVDRFRTILARFDRILSSISLENRKKSKGIIDDEDLDSLMKQKKDSESKKGEITDTEEEGGFFDGLKNLFGLGNDNDEINDQEQIKQEIKEGDIEPAVASEISEEDARMIIEREDALGGDGQVINMIDNNNFKTTNVAMGDINPKMNNTFSNLGNLSFDMLNQTITNNKTEQGVNDTIVDLSQQDSETPDSSGFSGLTATPTSVIVRTKFTSSGGAIDKFVNANALGAGMGLS